MQFPIVLHTDDGVSFGVTVPDLPGCFSGGEGLEDALTSAREAITLHLEGVLDEGGEIPVPANLTLHRDNPDFAGGVWAVVEVDTARFDGKAEKINITVPRRILSRIDACARERGTTRSGFLVQAARQLMAG